MREIEKKLKIVSRQYNSGEPHLASSLDLIQYCLTKLADCSNYGLYGPFNGRVRIDYFAFSHGNEFSRPIRNDLFINEYHDFHKLHSRIIKSLHQDGPLSIEEESNITRIIYTSVMAFASCIDLWKRGSRKIPGTFFEIFMAAMFKEFFLNYSFSKHIPLNNISEDSRTEESEKVRLSTDLVITSPENGRSAVIPLKITTRERIVQPFAHQRILDSAFGSGHYKSFLACVSETQMDHKSRSVKQVCVPGTVKLFKRYLGDIEGIYYCDIPERYDSQDLKKIIPVKGIGTIFNDIKFSFFLDS